MSRKLSQSCYWNEMRLRLSFLSCAEQPLSIKAVLWEYCWKGRDNESIGAANQRFIGYISQLGAHARNLFIFSLQQSLKQSLLEPLIGISSISMFKSKSQGEPRRRWWSDLEELSPTSEPLSHTSDAFIFLFYGTLWENLPVHGQWDV